MLLVQGHQRVKKISRHLCPTLYIHTVWPEKSATWNTCPCSWWSRTCYEDNFLLEITNGNWNMVFCPVMSFFMAYFTRNMDKCSRLHSFPVTRYTPFNTSAQKTELAHESKPHILPRVKGGREEDSGAYFWVVGWLAVPFGSAQMRANVYRTCI